MDKAISLLVIGGGQSASRSVLERFIADLPDSARPGRGPGLRLNPVHGIEEATAHLRCRHVDAILLDQCDVDRIGWLRMHAADLPILVAAGDVDGDSARAMIAEGAEDVLLPADMAAESFARRIDLAIARKAFEKDRLRHAREDPLTGLANGTLLEERFLRAVARTDRLQSLVGLVAIDIDGFGDLITSRGQAAADRLLPIVGRRFLDETRQMDTLARSRNHGFTWLVEGLASIEDINALVDRLPAQLAEPLSLDDQPIRLTASVGVAIFPVHGQDFRTLLSLAEAAMFDVSSISGDGLLMPPVPARPAALT